MVSKTIGGCSNHSAPAKHMEVVTQLVEHNLAKVGVASSSLVFRSKKTKGGFITSSFLITALNWVAKFLILVPTCDIFLLYINSRIVAIK